MSRSLVSNHIAAAFEADDDRRGELFQASRPWATLAGALVVLSFCLIFMWPWWNRYLGLTNEGWLQFFGSQILRGQAPYRDFYLHVPPGQPLIMAALASVFGNRIVVGEVFGLISAMALFLALYLWVVRIFPVFWSVVAVVSTAAIYLGCFTEPLGGVQIASILYPVLAFLAASFALDRDDGGLLAIFLAGFLAGASLAIKQTAGVTTALSLGVALPAIVAMRGRWWSGARAAAVFAAGWVVPVALISAWLAAHSALRNFIWDAFLHGPSSKGPLASLLVRQVVGIAGGHYLRICAALALAAILLLAFVYQRGGANRACPPQQSTLLFLLLILGVGAIATGTVVVVAHLRAPPHGLRWPGIMLRNVPVFFGELGSLVLLLGYGWVFLFGRRLRRIEEQYLLASAAAFVYAFVSSFSWATAENIVVPTFPLAFAFALSHARSGWAGRLAQGAALVLVLFGLATAASLKLQSPFTWAGWQEGDVRRATAEPRFPELRGITVTPETDRFLERLVADIQHNSRPDEPVAEFCCMPVLYLLAHRAPATFAYVHYIDVTPDDVFRADAERIVKNPPAVVVAMERSEEEVRDGEINFRGGQPSGERTLWTLLRNLGPGYRLADVLTTPNTNKRVQVWVRQSAAPPEHLPPGSPAPPSSPKPASS